MCGCGVGRGGGGGVGVISGGAYKEQFRVFMQHIPVL